MLGLAEQLAEVALQGLQVVGQGLAQSSASTTPSASTSSQDPTARFCSFHRLASHQPGVCMDKFTIHLRLKGTNKPPTAQLFFAGF